MSRHPKGSAEDREPSAANGPSAKAGSVLQIDGLRVAFKTPRGDAEILRGLSLQIGSGVIVGLVGETGSGKSMTAASVIGLIPPPGRVVTGSIKFNGDELVGQSAKSLNDLRGRRIGTIPQNGRAALHPLIRVGDQLVTVYRTHAPLSKDAARELALEMLRAVGFDRPGEVVRRYPHQLSGGMAQRVLIAMAFGPGPELIIADEPTTGLDATVQLRVLNRLRNVIKDTGASALLITHDLGIVAHFCDRVMVIHAGQIVEYSPVAEFYTEPLHPYSVGLLNSLPSAQGRPDLEIGGETPDPVQNFSGCRYRRRCPLAADICVAQSPAMEVTGSGHSVMCHRVDEVRRLNGSVTMPDDARAGDTR
jgi:oligopeptide/dipeptide ABC transporter ATP-binding protein